MVNQSSVSSTYASPILLCTDVPCGLENVIPGVSFSKAARSTHVMAVYRQGEAPDPCNIPRTQSSLLEKDLVERPSEVLTWYCICWSVCRSVDTEFFFAPRRLSAIPPTEGIMRSKAALQSLLKITALWQRRASPSYNSCFINIASVEERFGLEPH